MIKTDQLYLAAIHVYRESQVIPSFQPQIFETKTKMTLKWSKKKTKRLLSFSRSTGKEGSKKTKQLFISTNRYTPIAMNDDMELRTNTQIPATNSSI
jgi:hypothetical protein